MKYPCGICAKEVTKTKKSLACNLCELWFHYDCAPNMSEELYICCTKAFEQTGVSLFFCKPCQKVSSKLNKSLNEVKEENARLREKVEALERILDQVDKRIGKIENKTEKVKESLVDVEKEMASGMEKAKEEAKKDMKDEMREMEEKSGNIVVYGLKESAEPDAEKRSEEENAKVKEMAERMRVELKGEVAMKWRCGKRNEDANAKPRPMVVKVSDDETRENLFRNARTLNRFEEWKGVFVSQDLTYAQREEARKEEKKLRDEADAKTEAAKEEGKEEKWIVVGQRGRRRVVQSDGRRERRD